MRAAYIFTSLSILFMPLSGKAIDLQPNDIVAPPPNKTYAMLSYYGTENTNFYKNGSIVSSKPYGNPVVENPNVIL